MLKSPRNIELDVQKQLSNYLYFPTYTRDKKKNHSVCSVGWPLSMIKKFYACNYNNNNNNITCTLQWLMM